MLVSRADSSIALRLLSGADAAPSELEQEVTRLFDQLRNPLLRYLLAFGSSPQDGEEVIQEVFVALFKHLLRGKSRQNLRGWIFRVAHNLALKQRLRQTREVDCVAPEHLDPTPNPEERAAARQRHEHLASVLRALPEQDRCCLVLRAEGLRYREISQVLGISLGSVSNSLGRSLARFTRADRG
jgi:RNA polymerase sigma-70 factor, ECF subfamily